MDYMGGTLSYEGIELLRQVEKDYFNGSKGFETFLSSTGSIQYYCKKVEKVGKQICPFQMIQTASSEEFEFEYKKHLKHY